MAELCSWYVDLVDDDGMHGGNEACGIYAESCSWDEHQEHPGIRIVAVDNPNVDDADQPTLARWGG